MKSKPKSKFDEGPQATMRFKLAMQKILSVPHSEIQKREAEYQKHIVQNPRRRVGRAHRTVTSTAIFDSTASPPSCSLRRTELLAVVPGCPFGCPRPTRKGFSAMG